MLGWFEALQPSQAFVLLNSYTPTVAGLPRRVTVGATGHGGVHHCQ